MLLEGLEMLNAKKTWSSDDTRYIIFSACGYVNLGDDAIMLRVVQNKVKSPVNVRRKPLMTFQKLGQ